MSPKSFGNVVLREARALDAQDHVGDAVRVVRESDLPALPVLKNGKFFGIFGEREFIAALFPGYVGELGSASFIPRSMEAVIDKRASCGVEPIEQHVTTDHVAVDPDFSDVQLAEIFLHHRVLIIPVVDDGSMAGVITRSDFFAALAERFEALS